jgi:hypothetical protein
MYPQKVRLALGAAAACLLLSASPHGAAAANRAQLAHGEYRLTIVHTPQGRFLAPIMSYEDFASLTKMDALAIAADQQSPPPANQCGLSGQDRRYTSIELFFGRDIPGRGPLTDAEWDDFAARVITPQFPDGFTVLDGDGQWFNKASGRLIHEKTKILLVAADPDSGLKMRIDSVIAAYRAQFDQRSIGVLMSDDCGAF